MKKDQAKTESRQYINITIDGLKIISSLNCVVVEKVGGRYDWDTHKEAFRWIKDKGNISGTNLGYFSSVHHALAFVVSYLYANMAIGIHGKVTQNDIDTLEELIVVTKQIENRIKKIAKKVSMQNG
jgi:hypothetical protein